MTANSSSGSSIPWDALRTRSQSIAESLLLTNIDGGSRQALQREYALLSTVLHKHDEITSCERQLVELMEQERTAAQDFDFIALIREESLLIGDRLTQLQQELDDLLFPEDPVNRRDIFLEIRAGTGGQEAALFAGDLMRMYLLYAQRVGWTASIVSASPTDLGGYREIVLHIKGKHVCGDLKYESGVHRVQRVPSTETSGRIHTSTATVAVLPEGDDVETSIDPKDLRIDVYRSSGAGGQHVNTTDSAVRITHIPTGLVVACQDERSQHKNKAKAMKVLQARLRAAQEEKLAAEQSAYRKQLIGSGERAEKVRTYNFPQNRVSDHTADITLKSLDQVMDGNLGPIIESLRLRDEQERRKRPLPFSL